MNYFFHKDRHEFISYTQYIFICRSFTIVTQLILNNVTSLSNVPVTCVTRDIRQYN